MPGLTLYLSNRLENLADSLAELVREPIDTALQPETIVVQSRGMQRWISMALAGRNGICANTDFPFPNTFLDGVFRRIFPDLPEISPFEPDMLTAQIMKALPALVGMKAFVSLRRYLQDDPDRRKLYQLSDRIARTFDQYLVFRPQMMLEWEKRAERCEPDMRWQPMLWREIVRNTGHRHRAFLQRELLRHLKNRTTAQQLTSNRIHLFGISYLPPFHLQALAAMASVTSVNIFALHPCREYWADILDTRDIQRITRQYTIEEETEAYYYLDRGHPLLASMGKQGRDFLALVSDMDSQIVDCFTEVEEHDLLTGIQADILHLVDRASPPTAAEDRQPAAGSGVHPVRDESIQIHACHSPIREIEVLHDRLLAMFDSQPGLKPRDIVVMTPDIESYAPFIHAVFGTQLDPSTTIPYSISDQSTRRTSPAVDAFLQLLSIKGSRFTATQILSILAFQGTKERFGLTQADLELIAGWVADVNIRWGRDANSRFSVGLPAMAANTWKQGLQRLLLGIAMPADPQRLYAGILPYETIEGQDGQVLGRLLDFLQQVFDLADILGQPCKPVQWQHRLNDVLEQFFRFDERSQRELHRIRQVLENLGRMETVGGCDQQLTMEVVTESLEKSFQRSSHASGFISGSVTFCAMLPMRSIPFRVVCLIGLNSDALPRSQRPLGFDLISRHPQLGDRSRRNDDKYLFLEAILSARQNLYISYVGQSIEDNSSMPPSVLVSELIDTIRRGFGVEEDAIVLRHPLQAFSPRYFQGDGTTLFSYSRENFEAIRSLRRKSVPAPFFSTPLPEPPPEMRVLSPEQLSQFFHHPVRYLLQNRFSLWLEEQMAPQQDHEPFTLDALSRYQIGQSLFRQGLEGNDLKDSYCVQEATGRLPQGTVGEFTYRELQAEVEDFVSRVQSEVRSQQPRHLAVDLQMAEFTLAGALTDVYPGGRIQFRFARTKARDILSAWIGHLCLGLAADDRSAFRSTLVTADATLHFTPITRPEAILEDLLRIYWMGLHAPLHFFPELSLEYVRQRIKRERNPADVMTALRRKWTGSDFNRGELDDPYVHICFEHADPLDDAFQLLAERVFRPLFEAAREAV